MNFHDRKVIPPKYIYLFMTVICIIMLLLSIVFESRFSFLKSITGTIVTPMQTGVNAAGSSLYLGVKNSKEKKALMKENKELEAKLAEYKAKEKTYEQEKYELKRLQELLELKKQYVEYNTIGARVIATDSTNWFYTFIIDKGEEDGIKVGCNVLADGGLAGIVTEVGNGYSKVRSIIDDNSNVSASISGTDSLCTISGDISAMKKGYIHINYIDKADVIEEGAEIVTSHVSNKFLPGILIGYVSDVEMDSNNLTQSAKCIPVVDFSNLSEVLVITDLKKTYRTNSKSKNIYDSVTSPDTQVPEETSEEDETTTEADDDNDTEATTQEEQSDDSSEATREDAEAPDDQNEREEQH